MCGLVGIAGDLAFKDEITMKRLLLLDVFRGEHSTGMAAIRNTGEVKIAKAPGDPFLLFDTSSFKIALNANNSKVFLGHNRAATRGAINRANAHPFEYDHIVGAHNGTLDFESTKRLEEALGEKFPVDSMALIAAIAKFGVKDAIEMCREGKDGSTGAWALVWYDGMEGTINFLRNKHRPLWYGYTKDFKQLFWASEWPMIEAAMHLGSGYSVYTEPQTFHRFWQTEENVHFRFDVDVLRKGGDVRPKPTVKPIKGREPYAGVVSTIANDPFGRDQIGGTRNVSDLREEFRKRREARGKNSGSTSTTTSRSNNPLPVITLLGDLVNPFAGLVTKEKFDEIAKYGCSWCQQSIEFEEKGTLIFERDGIIICPECVVEDQNTRFVTPRDMYL